MNLQKKGNASRSGAFHYGFVIVACCCLMMGINVGIAFSCAGIMYKPICDTLKVSVGDFGLYMSVMYITSSLFLPYAGKLIERYSARVQLTVASAVMGVTLLAMSAFNAVWEFYVAGGIMGLTLAYLLYLAFPTLINRWFRSKVGLMIGICTAASGIGGIVLNPIAGYIITAYGWRPTYIFFATIVLVLVTPLLAVLLRNHPSEKGLEPYTSGKAGAAKKQSSGRDIEYEKALRMPVFYGVLLFAFLMMACSTLNLYIPNFVRSLNFSTEMAAYAASAVMAGVTIGKLLLGHINDLNCRMGVIVTTLAGIGGLIILLLLGSQGVVMILLGAFLFGWAYAGVMVQSAMLTRTVFGTKHYARINAMISIALAAGGAVASGMWGYIVEATSYATIFLIGIGMLAVALLLGLWALLRKGNNPNNVLTFEK